MKIVIVAHKLSAAKYILSRTTSRLALMDCKTGHAVLCKGTVSLSVTRNRRLTFRVDIAEQEIYDVNLEDYH